MLNHNCVLCISLCAWGRWTRYTVYKKHRRVKHLANAASGAFGIKGAPLLSVPSDQLIVQQTISSDPSRTTRLARTLGRVHTLLWEDA